MQILAVDAYLIDLPLTEPFVASHGTTTTRTVSFLRLTTDVGVGWGECSALPAATYTAESAAGSFRVLAEGGGPALVGQSADPLNLDLPDPDPLANLPMARSCVEMALLDAALKATGQSLAHWLHRGTETDGDLDLDQNVPATLVAGVSVGLASVRDTVDTCVGLASEGYRRLKVKIEPGHDLALVEQVVRHLPDAELHVDANGSFPGLVEPLLALADAGVAAIEQPFAPTDTGSAAALVASLQQADNSVLVVADEAVERPEDATRLLAASAMTGLSIKPGRVGGILAARDLHDRCRTAGVVATAGGMLETGLGRHGLAALATLPGFTLTGDLSPAGRWLAVDPWPDLTMTDGQLVVPTGPGVCGPPDLDLLAAHTVEHVSVGG